MTVLDALDEPRAYGGTRSYATHWPFNTSVHPGGAPIVALNVLAALDMLPTLLADTLLLPVTGPLTLRACPHAVRR